MQLLLRRRPHFPCRRLRSTTLDALVSHKCTCLLCVTPRPQPFPGPREICWGCPCPLLCAPAPSCSTCRHCCRALTCSVICRSCPSLACPVRPCAPSAELGRHISRTDDGIQRSLVRGQRVSLLWVCDLCLWQDLNTQGPARFKIS